MQVPRLVVLLLSVDNISFSSSMKIPDVGFSVVFGHVRQIQNYFEVGKCVAHQIILSS